MKFAILEAVNSNNVNVYATILFYREDGSTAYVYSYYQNRSSATGTVTSMKTVSL
ncbi:MAG: hypothetical protein LBU19_05180 [Treponema sp.]|jgi:hypothetical protein|nr:hypothetical protein [Treponema sp.]